MKIEDTTSGKYYRTELLVTLDDGRTVTVDITSSDPEPSYVEIESWGGREAFDEKISDGHYEREATRIVADKILSLGEK